MRVRQLSRALVQAVLREGSETFIYLCTPLSVKIQSDHGVIGRSLGNAAESPMTPLRLLVGWAAPEQPGIPLMC